MKEVNGSLPFLDVLISRNNKGFTTTVSHKPTFSGVYSNFNSFISAEYKHGLVFTLFFWIIAIVSNSFLVSWRSKSFKKCIKGKIFFNFFSW